MSIQEELRWGEGVLVESGSDSPRLDAQVLLSAVLQQDRLYLIVHDREELSPEQAAKYHTYIHERALGKPVSYITGEREFMGLTFRVNEAVLIPRPDTEVLVEEALREIRDGRWEMGDGRGEKDQTNKLPQGIANRIPRGNLFEDFSNLLLFPPEQVSAAPRVLDLCTGSGAIAISIKYYAPWAEVTATDLSEEALAVARENAERILGDAGDGRWEMGDGRWEMEDGRWKMEEGQMPVRFLQGDLFGALHEAKEDGGCHSEGEARRICSHPFELPAPSTQLFDLIVSNPPYIPAKVIDGLMPDVKDFEPRMALDGGEDGLEIYRRLIPRAMEHLAPGGVLLLEIGHDQGETVPELCRENGLTDVTVLKDLAGLDRVVRAKVGAKNALDKKEDRGDPVPGAEERIAFYEKIFDELSEADPETPLTERQRELFRILEEYYDSGQWRADYEADEAGLYPPDLKRGVLSQDGLYDLLSRLE